MNKENVKASVVSLKSQGYKKCKRCMKYTMSFNFDNLCDRCIVILVQDHPNHESVPLILQDLKERGLDIKNNPYYRNIQ